MSRQAYISCTQLDLHDATADPSKQTSSRSHFTLHRHLPVHQCLTRFKYDALLLSVLFYYTTRHKLVRMWAFRVLYKFTNSHKHSGSGVDVTCVTRYFVPHFSRQRSGFVSKRRNVRKGGLETSRTKYPVIERHITE